MSGRAGLARLVATLLLAAQLAWAGGAFAQTFPALSGRVVDAANIIPDDVEARLTEKLAGLETQSRRQLVIATLPSLEGYEISDYGYRLGRHWGIGDKERNDGALLIVAPNERKVRIEVGYGLEGILTDGLSSLIIQNEIIPKFKEGNMPAGIEAGTDALVTQLTLPEAEARIAAAEAQTAASSPEDGITPYFFFGLLFFFIFVLPVITSLMKRNGYRPKGLGPVILWTVADALANARTSSGSSSSGGGFSGGGGSFGGGGSSGSW